VLNSLPEIIYRGWCYEKKINEWLSSCGGKSVEHEISLQSAKNVIEAMDSERNDDICPYRY